MFVGKGPISVEVKRHLSYPPWRMESCGTWLGVRRPGSLTQPPNCSVCLEDTGGGKEAKGQEISVFPLWACFPAAQWGGNEHPSTLSRKRQRAGGAPCLSGVGADCSFPSPVSEHPGELPHRLHQALTRRPVQGQMLLIFRTPSQGSQTHSLPEPAPPGLPPAPPPAQAWPGSPAPWWSPDTLMSLLGPESEGRPSLG